MAVVIETTKGCFTVDLYVEQRPKVCKNFLKLCKVKYYNACLFHSVQPHFIAQTGDPRFGRGDSGGESIYRELYGDQARFFEGDVVPKMKHKKSGTISMVTAGSNMYGSQFFVTLADDLDALDGQHCVFGEISEGLESMVQMFNDTIVDGENRPYQDIRITHTVVLEDPFEDPKGLVAPPKSPDPSEEMLATTRIAADEDLDDYEGLTGEELAEMVADKEAKAQATILEMVGDLPDADCAPPENVLFVCKLNPVTTDEDLEIIFSRFGRVVSCEVIKDRKTGDSLQYAFVEFEDQKSCEMAYFKMDNVLIDDRRIHVDFSQSVSKFRWKGKGRLEILDEKKSEPKRRSKSSPPRRRSRPPEKIRKHRSRSRSREKRRHDHHRHERRERDDRRDHYRDKERKRHHRSRSRERSGRKRRSRSSSYDRKRSHHKKHRR